MSKIIHYSSPAGSYILPSGYTRLSYIQSTGTQYIDTEWKIDWTSDLTITAEIDTTGIPNDG